MLRWGILWATREGREHLRGEKVDVALGVRVAVESDHPKGVPRNGVGGAGPLDEALTVRRRVGARVQ